MVILVLTYLAVHNCEIFGTGLIPDSVEWVITDPLNPGKWTINHIDLSNTMEKVKELFSEGKTPPNITSLDTP
jgi:hypothetical protein